MIGLTLLTIGILALAAALFMNKRFRGLRVYIIGAAIFLILFSLKLFVINSPVFPELNQLNGLEKISEAFIQTLQSYSMDADYTTFLADEKKAIDAALAAQSIIGPNAQLIKMFLVNLTALLDIAAPLSGLSIFAMVLNVVFPMFRLYAQPLRAKIVFTPINVKTILIAEQIYQDSYDHKEENLRALYGMKPGEKLHWYERKPLIIFSDSYQDETSEQDMELLARARKIQAVVLKADLRFLRFPYSSQVVYFLMEKMQKNFDTLVDLERVRKKNELYPFGRTNVYVYLDNPYWINPIDHIAKEFGDQEDDVPDKIAVHPIKDYMTTTFSLFRDYPLFLPLIGKPRNEARQQLKIVIAGDTQAVQETFKSALSLGQMESVRLSITLMAPECRQVEDGLNQQSPELIESCNPDSEVLNWSTDPDCPQYGRAYASLDFVDFDQKQFLKTVSDADYLVLCFEDEYLNMQLAGSASSKMRQQRFDRPVDGNPVIVPLIHQETLSKGLASSLPVVFPVDFSEDSSMAYEPLIFPYGLDAQRYSLETALQMNICECAAESDRLYNEMHTPPEKYRSPSDNPKPDKTVSMLYIDWANWAKASHAVYKLFDLGLIKKGKVNIPDKPEEGRFPSFKITELGRTKFTDPKIIAQLTWVENRRWRAFTRSMGFSILELGELGKLNGKPKSEKLGKHACLVETNKDAALPAILRDEANQAPADRLDALSEKLLKNKKNKKELKPDATLVSFPEADYKINDLPCMDAGLTKMIHEFLGKDPYGEQKSVLIEKVGDGYKKCIKSNKQN